MKTLPKPEIVWDNFVKRDNNAVNELNNWMSGPITESRRLEFLEGRVKDLCGMVDYLYQYIEENIESKKK